MAALNPKIEPDGPRQVRMVWTPDPAAFGYRFYVNDHPVSKSSKPGQKTTTFDWDGQPTAYGIAASYEHPAETVLYPTPPLPPGPTILPPVGPFGNIDGGYTVFQSPAAYKVTAGAATVRKLNVRNMTGRGVGSMQGYPPTVPMPARSTIEDCIVDNVSAKPPLSAGGTSEACAWVGNPSDVRRLKLTRGSWMGLWTGSRCIGSVFEDIDIETPGVGIYCEHVTKDSTFRRFKIKSGDAGILMEWWYKQLSYGPGYVGYGELEGTSGCVFEDGEIYCPSSSSDKVAGVFADAGTFGCTFRRIRFWGPGVALRLPDPSWPDTMVDPTRPNIVEDCVFDQEDEDIVYHRRKIGWNGQ